MDSLAHNEKVGGDFPPRHQELGDLVLLHLALDKTTI